MNKLVTRLKKNYMSIFNRNGQNIQPPFQCDHVVVRNDKFFDEKRRQKTDLKSRGGREKNLFLFTHRKFPYREKCIQKYTHTQTHTHTHTQIDEGL